MNNKIYIIIDISYEKLFHVTPGKNAQCFFEYFRRCAVMTVCTAVLMITSVTFRMAHV